MRPYELRRRKFDRGLFGERTIRDGTVRFYGRTFRLAPRETDPPYDGRLDGRRALFYSYDPSAKLDDSVFLHSFGEEFPGPNCIDGYFRWERWNEVKA